MSSEPSPILKWSGGKSQLIPHLLPIFKRASYQRYVDLFCGSLALPLALQPEKLLLNDINRPLIHLYQTISKAPEELLQSLENYNSEEKNDKDAYELIRSQYNEEKNNDELSIEVASQFIYLNKRGFNGLYRENSKGQYNVPYRAYKSAIFDKEKILKLSQWFGEREVKFSTRSYLDCLDEIEVGDIVYLDPPYYPKEGKSTFVSYWKDGFSVADQERLAEKIRELDRRGVLFVLSNTPCDEIRQLYTGFSQETVKITRSMRSGKGKTSCNDEDNEIIITNVPTRVEDLDEILSGLDFKEKN